MVNKLIQVFATLPGLGPKSAKRIVLHLMENSGVTSYLNELLNHAREKISFCTECHNLSEGALCNICSDPKREADKICIVDCIEDLWNIEGTRHYNGLYYIPPKKENGGSRIAQEINIETLLEKVRQNNITEIILANSPTVKGQTKAFYITDALRELITEHNLQTVVTILGRGIPIGSEIDYLDENTIKAAFQSRKNAS